MRSSGHSRSRVQPVREKMTENKTHVEFSSGSRGTFTNGRSGVRAMGGDPGGGLAHAFFLTGAVDFASEVHVNDEEPWRVLLDKNPSNKYHLLLTLTHEIGHTLSLQHSMRNNSQQTGSFPRRRGGRSRSRAHPRDDTRRRALRS
ncbi:hypothetical protein ACFW04_012492 [Cataglyphis niger]